VDLIFGCAVFFSLPGDIRYFPEAPPELPRFPSAGLITIRSWLNNFIAVMKYHPNFLIWVTVTTAQAGHADFSLALLGGQPTILKYEDKNQLAGTVRDIFDAQPE